MIQLEEAFTRLSDSFFAADDAAVLAVFEFPMAIYADGGVLVFSNAGALKSAMSRYRKLLIDNNICDIEASVAAVPLLRGLSGTIWIDVTYYDAGGAPIDTSQLRYFFRLSGGRPRIAMIEYTKTPALICTRAMEQIRAA